MINNFLFDVDRTLVNSYIPELETLKEALYRVKNIQYGNDTMDLLSVLTTKQFFEKIGISTDSKELQEINNIWGNLLNQRKLTMFEGIKDVLIYLKEKNKFLGIITSRDKEELYELECLSSYLNLFDVIVTSDMIKNPKPNPESINFVLEKYHLKNLETVYIGDSENDFIAAKSANILFGHAKWDNNISIPYDFLFKTPKELKKIILFQF